MGLGYSVELLSDKLVEKKTVKEAFMLALAYVCIKGFYQSNFVAAEPPKHD